MYDKDIRSTSDKVKVSSLHQCTKILPVFLGSSFCNLSSLSNSISGPQCLRFCLQIGRTHMLRIGSACIISKGVYALVKCMTDARGTLKVV